MSSNESQVIHCHDFSESFPLFKQHTAGVPQGRLLSISQDVHVLAHQTRDMRKVETQAKPRNPSSCFLPALPCHWIHGATFGLPSLHPRLHCKRGSPNTDLSTDLVCFLNSSTLALLPGTSHRLRHFGVASDGGAIREQSPTPCRLQC